VGRVGGEEGRDGGGKVKVMMCWRFPRGAKTKSKSFSRTRMWEGAALNRVSHSGQGRECWAGGRGKSSDRADSASVSDEG
jgi:hypothetical protein